jgi:hypothetical protein
MLAETSPWALRPLNLEVETMTIPLSAKAAHALSEQPIRLKFLYRFFKRYRKIRREILLDNAQDFRLSRRLSRALNEFASVEMERFVSNDDSIGGEWRPFRVEHSLSGSIRGDIRDHASFTGVVTPNMLDCSSVIFLQNDGGQTMRAIIPSKGTAGEMFLQSIKKWRVHAGYDTYWERDTHTSRMLHCFVVLAPWNKLVHPQTIDMIDASCQKERDQRPVVRIKGSLIQNGIAMISAIYVDGYERTFVPTSFFRSLTGVVQKHVPGAQEPKLIAA